MCGLELSTRESDGHGAVALRGEPDTAAAADVAAAVAAVAVSEPQIIADPPGLRSIDARSRRDDRSHHKARNPGNLLAAGVSADPASHAAAQPVLPGLANRP
jgi:hypothetical protein